MELSIQTQQLAFNGVTKIYAISDSHQETRRTRMLLSKVLKESKNKKNVLLLNGGDIFKGVYPQNLERDTYIKMKELNPNIEMVMTLGNNDFGFSKESLNYLIETVKQFTQKGIKVVCANIFNSSNSRPEWLKPYTIVERDGDKTLITGFCIDNINTAKFGIIPKNQDDVLEEIINAVKKEKPDNVVILNHDYMNISKKLHNRFKKEGINIDIIIGGHDHEKVSPDLNLHIYYPEAFSTSMYEMNLINKNGKKSIKDLSVQRPDGLKVDKDLTEDLENFERETGLHEKIVPSVLHLPKIYSDTCALGSFLADSMKKYANCDIGFFSTGFLMKPLEYEPNGYITKYKLKKTMIAENPVKKVELTPTELLEIFKHAMKGYGYGASNPKFLQCSNNMKLEGKDNPEKGLWELKQIYIDNKPLFDSEMNPVNPNKKYTCAIDWFIAEGGQGFETLQKTKKENILINGEPLRINEALLKGLIDTSKIYKNGAEYPHFEIIK